MCVSVCVSSQWGLVGFVTCARVLMVTLVPVRVLVLVYAGEHRLAGLSKTQKNGVCVLQVPAGARAIARFGVPMLLLC